MKQLINLAVSVNPLGMPANLIPALRKKLGKIGSYPDPYDALLKKEISKYLKLRSDQMVVGNGCSDILFSIPRALKIKSALVVSPTFWEYEYTVKKNGGTVEYFLTKEKEGFEIDFGEFRGAIKRFKFVYICNPNNPTSVYYPREKLISLVKEFPDATFIIDETYLFFDEEYNKKTLNSFAQGCNNLIVVASFSKIFAVPGLRIGFGVGSAKIIERISSFKVPYLSSPFSSDIIGTLLDNAEYLKSSRKYVEIEKKRIYQLYKKSELLTPFEPQANFILCKLKGENINAGQLVLCLEKEGILIRECSKFKGLDSNWIRFSIGKKEVNNILYEKIQRIDRLHKSGKLELMLAELNTFLKAEFEGKSFFTVVYGSYADGTYTDSSDLDIMIACNNPEKKSIRKVINFVKRLHRKFSLKLDTEVKYENKLVVSYDSLLSACAGKGFELEGDRFLIKPVLKTRRYLDSTELRLRLLLGVLSHRHIFVSGDERIYSLFRQLALTNLVSLLCSNKKIREFSKKELIDLFISNGEATGDYHLGYLENWVDRSYLYSLSEEIILDLKAEKRVKIKKGRYMPSDYPFGAQSAEQKTQEYAKKIFGVAGKRGREIKSQLIDQT